MPSACSGYPLPARCRARSALVFEADLDLDPVLDDLAVLDLRRRVHDLDRLDVPDGAGRGGHGLTGRIGPRLRARPDHLPNDDHAHRLDLPGWCPGAIRRWRARRP